MEFIICDSDRMELCALPDTMTVDFDVGNTNDVQITCLKSEGLDFGMWLICPGTEYGALLEEVKESTNSNEVYWLGDSFRGFLKQFIIQPPDGEDYYTVSGEANAILREVIGEAFGGMFTVPDVDSGITVKTYSFNRYTDALTGFTKMLSSYDARVNIEIVQGGSNEAFTVQLTAVPIQNMSSEIEYSQDSGISVDLDECRRGITHLICLGQGELAERTVVHLYLQEDGSIGTTKHYTGLHERMDVYDYSGAESEEELISGGEEYFKSLTIPSKSMEMNVDEDVDLQVGDIIAGRNYDSGLYLSKPITQKIIQVKKGRMTTEYKVEGAE